MSDLSIYYIIRPVSIMIVIMVMILIIVIMDLSDVL